MALADEHRLMILELAAAAKTVMAVCAHALAGDPGALILCGQIHGYLEKRGVDLSAFTDLFTRRPE